MEQREKTKRLAKVCLCAALVLTIVGAITVYCIRHYQAMQLLELGISGEVITAQQELADYENLSGAIARRAAARCKRLLYDGEYSKARNLYDTLIDYPDALAKMDEKLGEYMNLFLDLYDWDTVTQLGKSFLQCEHGYAVIESYIEAVLLDQRENSDSSYRSIYRDLAAEGVIVESIGIIIYDQFCDAVKRKDETDASSRLYCLANDEERMTAVYAFIMEQMEGYLRNNDASHADFVHYFMRRNDLDYEMVSTAIYQHASNLMQQGYYDEAEDFCYILYNAKDPYYYNDVYFMVLQLWMREYLEEGKYEKAKALIGGYTGERREILLAIYREYCPDEPG